MLVNTRAVCKMPSGDLKVTQKEKKNVEFKRVVGEVSLWQINKDTHPQRVALWKQ
jgi:hypothetical protein